MKLIERDIPPRAVWALEQAGVHPLLARLFAARGVNGHDELDDGLARLLPPGSLKGAKEAAMLLADAIAADRRLCIVADYDCDGATACAVAVRGLRLLGAKHVDYLVPDRVVHGYGLTPPIARRVKERGADVLITVDNGIASVEGVAEARALGLQVLVTDHHLPAAPAADSALPNADVIVNPNQPGCAFESKSMAGVGVMFYVLLALRAELRHRGAFDAATQPKSDAIEKAFLETPKTTKQPPIAPKVEALPVVTPVKATPPKATTQTKKPPKSGKLEDEDDPLAPRALPPANDLKRPK